MRDMKISIITATFNSEATLEQTVTSVVRQDYPYIEFIIIDGASNDGTIDIIKKYEGKIELRWISEHDKGIYDAFNKGIDMATGDYIQFLGSDDSLYDANTISKVVKQLDKEIDILSASVMVVDEKTKTQYSAGNHHALEKNVYRGGMVPHQGLFVKTSLLKKYKFDISYKISADYKFFLQCYYDEAITIKYIDLYVAFYTNTGISSDHKMSLEEDNRVCCELGLQFYSPSLYSPYNIKRLIKDKMVEDGILSNLMKAIKQYIYYIKSHFIWAKHTCDNPKCRWCGRT